LGVLENNPGKGVSIQPKKLGIIKGNAKKKK
jgi:hypothetical protein